VTGSANPVGLTMDRNKTVTAVYAQQGSSPQIQLSSSSLTFSAPVGGPAPAAQAITIANSGAGTLSGLISSFPDGTPLWLSSQLSGGTAPATVTLQAQTSNPFGQPYGAGTLTTRVAISSSMASNSPQYINVALTLVPPSSITAYASYDNMVWMNSIDPTWATQVNQDTQLCVGWNYFLYGVAPYYTGCGSAIKFDIQSQIAGRTIASATLKLYVYKVREDLLVSPDITLNAFAASWDPNSLTWTSWLATTYRSEGEVRLPAPSSSALPLEFDVTTIVQRWASGNWGNYGFKLRPPSPSDSARVSVQSTIFQSLEMNRGSATRPQLTIDFR
jgi:hypothetical protein